MYNKKYLCFKFLYGNKYLKVILILIQFYKIL